MEMNNMNDFTEFEQEGQVTFCFLLSSFISKLHPSPQERRRSAAVVIISENCLSLSLWGRSAEFIHPGNLHGERQENQHRNICRNQHLGESPEEGKPVDIHRLSAHLKAHSSQDQRQKLLPWQCGQPPFSPFQRSRFSEPGIMT